MALDGVAATQRCKSTEGEVFSGGYIKAYFSLNRQLAMVFHECRFLFYNFVLGKVMLGGLYHL